MFVIIFSHPLLFPFRLKSLGIEAFSPQHRLSAMQRARRRSRFRRTGEAATAARSLSNEMSESLDAAGVTQLDDSHVNL